MARRILTRIAILKTITQDRSICNSIGKVHLITRVMGILLAALAV